MGRKEKQAEVITSCSQKTLLGEMAGRNDDGRLNRARAAQDSAGLPLADCQHPVTEPASEVLQQL